ncbi:MAG: type III-A CRISPR-associated protein Csm2 [Methanobrevibacter sp.]|jgi:CRISPR-associated protein Csm2|nr:type III-A CRISPR-associated protein Csm2 [Methanobrevibacter sp.]
MSYNDRNQRNNRNSDNRNSDIDNIISEISKVKMLKDLKAKEYADEKGYADKIAKHFSGRNNELKTNQLRKLFGALRDIESKEGNWEEIEPQFYLLKPKLAYDAGRNLIPKDFYKLMMNILRKVDIGNVEDKNQNFKTLINFLEAIVSYRKFYGDK